MKKIILSVAAIAALSFVSCKEEAKNVENTAVETVNKGKDAFSMENSEVVPAKTMAKTTIKLDKTTHDFGTINEDDVVSTVFKVTNTGKNPLQLDKPKVSCGCTTPTYPKDLIMPGETEDIVVEFNSKGKPNKQSKNVTLTGNFEKSPTRISFTAFVNPKAKTDDADDHSGHGH